MQLLQANQLSCARGGRALFSQLTFAVEQAQIWHVRGVNGSGKTSLLRILAGLMLPTAGQVTQQLCAYLGHRLALSEQLTVLENLYYAQALHCSQTDVCALLAQVGLQGYEDKLVAYLSAGQQRRVALAQLLLQPAKLWILDEPLTALDAASIVTVETLLQQHLKNGGSVVLASHQPLSLPAVHELFMDDYA